MVGLPQRQRAPPGGQAERALRLEAEKVPEGVGQHVAPGRTGGVFQVDRRLVEELWPRPAWSLASTASSCSGGPRSGGPALETAQFGLPYRFRPVMEGCHQRGDRPGGQRGVVSGRTPAPRSVRRPGLRLAALRPGGHERADVVHVEQA